MWYGMAMENASMMVLVLASKKPYKRSSSKAMEAILQNAHDVVVFINTTINLPHAAYDFVR
jgi:signal recognition particle receptor subunit beta